MSKTEITFVLDDEVIRKLLVLSKYYKKSLNAYVNSALKEHTVEKHDRDFRVFTPPPLRSTIMIDGEYYSLVEYRSFTYKKRKYTIFIQPDITNADGHSACCLLYKSGSQYKFAPKAVIDEIGEWLADFTAGKKTYNGPTAESLNIKIVPYYDS